MGQELDVLDVVVRLGSRAPLVDFLLVQWLLGVDSFQDAQAPGTGPLYNVPQT